MASNTIAVRDHRCELCDWKLKGQRLRQSGIHACEDCRPRALTALGRTVSAIIIYPRESGI